ncbi:uncharacterized protein EV420DRAFT_1542078 [Desarmillaria tabescens]|uniref:Uncharacterized protein n=1 Tax=Armillaria tabescens TaxID=1929756 RepID=A0AA39N5V1_ARMTA|nr:uncharacterized protein EV420DRAFT_1542078 [Desarmillaria tabescens]KAK0458405.1 hypothetical protein EV420DRAFT_1542078 [Desarmillaria tabescens]
MSLSPLTALPPRGQCTQVIDNVQHCHCPCFTPPASILLDQNICGLCGHGIHSHVDYVSMVVDHYPQTQCAAYVQKTPLTQCCTCEAWLSDHVAINNWFRSVEPRNVMGNFSDIDGPSSDANAIRFSNDAINNPSTPSFIMSSPSASSDTITFFHDANLVLSTGAPIFSPSTNSAPSDIQSDITQTQAYASDHHSVQYPDHFINSYTRQPDGDAADESLYYHNDPNVIYSATPDADAWPGSHA